MRRSGVLRPGSARPEPRASDRSIRFDSIRLFFILFPVSWTCCTGHTNAKLWVGRWRPMSGVPRIFGVLACLCVRMSRVSSRQWCQPAERHEKRANNVFLPNMVAIGAITYKTGTNRQQCHRVMMASPWAFVRCGS